MADQVSSPETTLTWTVPVDRESMRLDAFVRECLPHLSRRQVDRAIRDRLFSVGDKVGKKGDRLAGGDKLVFRGLKNWLVSYPLPGVELEVPIVYEDSSILVVNKPAGMPTHGFSGRAEGTLANFIASMNNAPLAVGKSRWEAGIVHRLDTDTSGLVLVAKTQAAFDELRRQFRRRRIKKIYWALVRGSANAQGEIDLPLAHDSRDKRRMRTVSQSSPEKKVKTWKALTRYRKLGQSGGFSFLEIEMATGVTHQIRVHLAAIGHPIVGDALYGVAGSNSFVLPRHFLHACRLEFRHPENQRNLTVEAQLPGDLQEVLNRLKFKF